MGDGLCWMVLVVCWGCVWIVWLIVWGCWVGLIGVFCNGMVSCLCGLYWGDVWSVGWFVFCCVVWFVMDVVSCVCVVCDDMYCLGWIGWLCGCWIWILCCGCGCSMEIVGSLWSVVDCCLWVLCWWLGEISVVGCLVFCCSMWWLSCWLVVWCGCGLICWWVWLGWCGGVFLLVLIILGWSWWFCCWYVVFGCGYVWLRMVWCCLCG